jgi:hypothetical protein
MIYTQHAEPVEIHGGPWRTCLTPPQWIIRCSTFGRVMIPSGSVGSEFSNSKLMEVSKRSSEPSR